MITLTKPQVLALHAQLASSSIRDPGLLDSALAAPAQTFSGSALYPAAIPKAVRLGCALLKNRPFLDGNKRIAAHAMLVTLAANGIRLAYTQEELFQAIRDAASGELSYQGLLKWVLDHEVEEGQK